LTVVAGACALLVFAAPAQASLSAVTNPASGVTATSATLNGEVDPSGSAPSYYFEYGLTSAYGAKTAAVPFESLMKVQALVIGLTPGTSYHFRMVAKRDDRAARGSDQSFTTPTSLLTNPGTGLADPLGGLPVIDSSSGGSKGGDGGGEDGNSGPGSGDPATGDSSGDGSRGSGGDGNGADEAANAAPAAHTAPVLGSTVAAAPDSGSIRVRPPGEETFVPLDDGAPIPVGSIVDARRGRVHLVTAIGHAGEVQSATFQGAVFQVRQGARAAGLTDLFLRGGNFRACRQALSRRPRASRAASGGAAPARAVSATRRRRPIRRLWGRDHHGSFRTHGRGAIATVRGTTWAVADYCDGTRTSVRTGAVSVWDKSRRRKVLVRAGHSYFARTSG
jgi:hypothetical protein